MPKQIVKPHKNIREYTYITEYSFDIKNEHFVVRFLDGTSYILKISDLPAKLQTHKPKWEHAILSDDHSCLIVKAGKSFKNIPFNIVYSKGCAI